MMLFSVHAAGSSSFPTTSHHPLLHLTTTTSYATKINNHGGRGHGHGYFSSSAACCTHKHNMNPTTLISKRGGTANSMVVSCSSGGGGATAEEGLDQRGGGIVERVLKAAEDASNSKGSTDWKAARAYKDSGAIYEGRIEGYNGGGLLIRFYSVIGFLPFSQLSPTHSHIAPQNSLFEIAKDMVGSSISTKVLLVSEENKKLVFSEKEAKWVQYGSKIQIGDVFDATVMSVEQYGAFVDLRFSDGLYHMNGLVHISEISWDFLRDVRDVIRVGDEVQVKVIHIDNEKRRFNLSIKQLKDDPLLATLDKVINEEDQSVAQTSESLHNANQELVIELEGICEELLKEEGVTDVRIGRHGFERRAVSQDLELWLSSAPAADGHFTILARAGRKVQELHLTTTLDLEGIKKAIQRVSGRVP